MFDMTKFLFPDKVADVICTLVFARQLTVTGLDLDPVVTVPNWYGEEQLSGRLTGEPKPYKKP